MPYSSTPVTSKNIVSKASLAVPAKTNDKDKGRSNMTTKPLTTAKKGPSFTPTRTSEARQEKAMREELSNRIKRLDHRVKPENPKDARLLANTAIDLVEQQQKKEPPWTALQLKIMNGPQAERRKEMLTVKQNLELQLKKTRLEGRNLKSDEVTYPALQTLEGYRNYMQMGGRTFGESSRRGIEYSVNLARDMSVTAATAGMIGRTKKQLGPAKSLLAGVSAGAAVALASRLPDQLNEISGGKKMITTTPVADAGNVLGTAAAMFIPEALHSHNAAEPVTKIEKLKDFAKDTALHFASDVTIGAGVIGLQSRMEKKDSLNQTGVKMLESIKSTGSSSLLSSIGVAALSQRFPKQRDTFLAGGEFLERLIPRPTNEVLTTLSNKSSTSSQPQKTIRTNHGINHFGLIPLQDKEHQFSPVGPLSTLNKIREETDKLEPKARQTAIPPSGIYSTPAQVEMAVNEILKNTPPENHKQLLERLLQQ
jgi:uncharacterized membrane protein (UPF0136 family)